ncbi:MAG TPA: acylphosphatase [Marmoricola sp.]|nr:acylphosphatase [Marmoricola sp.]
MKAVDVRITGRVQGVSFRYYTQLRAQQLGLTGWVRNEPDGSVAGHFEGAPGAVDGLVAWCGQGPSAARVESVEVVEVPPAGGHDFVVRGV